MPQIKLALLWYLLAAGTSDIKLNVYNSPNRKPPPCRVSRSFEPACAGWVPV